MGSSSDCPLLWPQTVGCSGTGTCLNVSSSSTTMEGGCSCFAGYTGIGDFALEPGADCDLNMLAIRILYGISILPSMVSAGLSTRYIWLKRAQMNNSASEQKWTDPINTIPFCALLGNICLIIVASIKVYNPEYAVGNSIAVTVAFGILFFGFWTAQLGYLYVFLELTAKQARIKSPRFRDKVVTQLSNLKRFLIGVFIVDFVWGFSPLILLGVPSAVHIIGPIHYIGAALNIAILAFGAVPRTLAPVRDDIREALKTQVAGGQILPSKTPTDTSSSSPSRSYQDHTQIRQMMMAAEKKLTFLCDTLKRSALQETIVASVLGLWPYLLRKASYQLPLTWSIATIFLCIEVYSISNFTKPSTSKTDSKHTDTDPEGGMSSQVGRIGATKVRQDLTLANNLSVTQDLSSPSVNVDLDA